MPQDKQRTVEAYKNHGEIVMKVGDCINDAPALADVGVAMVGSTDVALATADAAVLHGRGADLPALIDLFKQPMGVIWQNLHRARTKGGIFGHHYRGGLRPLARHPSGHRCDRARPTERAAAALCA